MMEHLENQQGHLKRYYCLCKEPRIPTTHYHEHVWSSVPLSMDSAGHISLLRLFITVNPRRPGRTGGVAIILLREHSGLGSGRALLLLWLLPLQQGVSLFSGKRQAVVLPSSGEFQGDFMWTSEIEANKNLLPWACYFYNGSLSQWATWLLHVYEHSSSCSIWETQIIAKESPFSSVSTFSSTPQLVPQWSDL